MKDKVLVFSDLPKQPVLSEQEFRYGWKILHKIRDTLAAGCGRDTVMYEAHKRCHVWHSPNFYRKVLNEACRRGWAEKKKKEDGTGYSIFILLK